MSEISRFFADVAGDRLNTAAQMNRIFDQILQEKDGVIRGLANTLAVTNAGTVAVDVNTGSAIMGGRLYENTASKNLALDAVTSGSKRYDRIVVRVNETARTMLLTVIKGVEGASPSVPAIDGTTDVLLAKILLDRSSGSYVYTLTDERTYCDGLLLPAIVTKLNTGTFREDDVADGTTYKRVAAAKATAINGNTYSQDDVIDGTTYKRIAAAEADKTNAGTYRFPSANMVKTGTVSSGSSTTPQSTGISVNAGNYSRDILLMLSGHISSGDNTCTALYHIRCGREGDYWQGTLLSAQSAGGGTTNYYQLSVVSGILHINTTVLTNFIWTAIGNKPLV